MQELGDTSLITIRNYRYMFNPLGHIACIITHHQLDSQSLQFQEGCGTANLNQKFNTS
jgi:hypothetical protein